MSTVAEKKPTFTKPAVHTAEEEQKRQREALPEKGRRLVDEHKLIWGIPPLGSRVLLFARNFANHPTHVVENDILGKLKHPLWHKVIGEAHDQLQRDKI